MDNESFPKPRIIPRSQWKAFAPLGFDADALRRNIPPGEKLRFHELTVELLEMIPLSLDDESKLDKVKVLLTKNDKSEIIIIAETKAFNWEGYHIDILSANTRQGQLGYGLTEFEICTIASMPEQYAQSTIAGGAEYRVRVQHEIQIITLHHTGDVRAMSLDEDPVKRLQALQNWGKRARNWWDIPYHFLIAPDGRIYAGRDFRYMGETNTQYNPWGHLLISCIGNYNLQKPTAEVIQAITDLMAWAVQEFQVPLNKIYGHSDLAQTACPGENLEPLLRDGTFHRGIKERLGLK